MAPQLTPRNGAGEEDDDPDNEVSGIHHISDLRNAPKLKRAVRKHWAKTTVSGVSLAGVIAAWNLLGPNLVSGEARKVAKEEVAPIAQKLDEHIKKEEEHHEKVQEAVQKSSNDLSEMKGMLKILCGKKCDK